MIVNNYDRDMKAIQDKRLRILERDIRENTEYLKHAESTVEKIEKECITLLTAKEKAETAYEEASGYLEEMKTSVEQTKAVIAKAEVEMEELKKKLTRK